MLKIVERLTHPALFWLDGYYSGGDTAKGIVESPVSAELDEAVSAIRGSGCEQFALLKCTSTYPATSENSNVATIPHMRELFDCEVGLSDHTMGVGASVAAVAHGATVIEKHFTLR